MHQNQRRSDVESIKSSPSQDQVAAQFHFAVLAGQYYVAGRFAALTHCLPVAGSLLHHAIEMFLKCALARTLTLAELKRMGHSLPKLWRQFTSANSDQNLSHLNYVVGELDRFERLRYPDSAVVEGMQISLTILKAHFSPLPEGPQPAYHLILEDVDLLAQITSRCSGLSRTSFLNSLSTQADHFLELDNKHPI